MEGNDSDIDGSSGCFQRCGKFSRERYGNRDGHEDVNLGQGSTHRYCISEKDEIKTVAAGHNDIVVNFIDNNKI